MRRIFIAAGICLLLSSCSEIPHSGQDYPQLSKMKWLIGTWKGVSSDGEFYEIWNMFNDSAYTGIGFMIVKGDTLFSEIVSLEAKNGELFYIPTVNGQNNGMPVSFKLAPTEGDEYVFENKEHDFPQRIIYKNKKPDSLYARVEGIEDGVFRKEEFTMRREK